MNALGRSPRILGLSLAAALVASAAWAAQSSQAAVTIGSTFTPDEVCAEGITFVQSSSAGSAYAAPSAGVITSWSHEAAASPPALRFKVARPLGGNDFALVGESALTPQTANDINTFPARIPVQSGDVIGFFIGGAAPYDCGRLTGDASDFARAVPGDVPSGTTTYPNSVSSFRLDVAAQLEPDADGDGFGDETQDGCPTDPSTQGPCPPDDGSPPPDDGTTPPDDGTTPPDDGTTPPVDGVLPSNEFSFGKVKRNKKRGTAKLPVEVPGPGELALAKTKKVKKDVEQIEVTTSGPAQDGIVVKLKVKARGKAKKRLNRKGKAKVKAKVTYTPDGGEPNTQSKKLKLKKR